MDQTVHEIDVPQASQLCPRIDHSRQFWVNTYTGERRPDSCRANCCPVCIVRNAQKKARILTWAAPQRYAVMTQAPQDWVVLRQKMRNLPRLLARRGYCWEHAWTVEINPRATGLHVNILQRGDYVPQDELQRVWGAIVHIQAIKGATGARAVAGYSVKEARRVTGYTLKDAGAGADTSEHLRVNGKRLAHVSRSYLPENPDTAKPYTQAEAWAEIRSQGEPGWMLVT